MFAINKKYWSNLKNEFHARSIWAGFEHFLQGPRFWDFLGSVFIAVLLLGAITVLAMLASWMSKIDISTFDVRPMLR